MCRAATDGLLRALLRWLRDEARLIEMDYHIKLNLIIDEQNHEKCLKVFNELVGVSRSPTRLSAETPRARPNRQCRASRACAALEDMFFN